MTAKGRVSPAEFDINQEIFHLIAHLLPVFSLKMLQIVFLVGELFFNVFASSIRQFLLDIFN